MSPLRRLLFRLRFGRPRPCPDDECVRATPEEHGMEPIMELVGRTQLRESIAELEHPAELTELERAAVSAAACGNCGERAAVLNLAARIKAEAVQAERERVTRECEKRAENAESLGWARGANAYRSLARFARGEGR